MDCDAFLSLCMVSLSGKMKKNPKTILAAAITRAGVILNALAPLTNYGAINLPISPKVCTAANAVDWMC